ncbi:chromosome segregation ATPase [Tolypothrix sp. VBCCA 56010]|uniref:chromosome segregation ATPase n=1 Tax=Tolypothrix sp. VBCCA 56010 TaxID=3137731 RepID=UPI003D7E3704
MTERDIPESWSSARATEPDEITRLSRSLPIGDRVSGVPANGSTSKSVKRRKKRNSDKEQGTASTFDGQMPNWMKSWVLWAVLLALIPGSIGFISMAMLLKLPSAPNCPSIFWPLASASVRLHCAQLAASKQTVNDLLQAIALVKQLPENHPLRAEINRNLEEWSRSILQLADQSFQSGKLDEAIATAHKIPQNLSAEKLVDEQITKWQSIWSKGENIYQKAEEELRQAHWQSAFMVASKLLRVDNKYWQTAKYDQLNRLIVSAREDGEKLAKANGLAEDSGVDNLLKAIKIAESIGQDSYVYQKAQATIPVFGRKILALAQKKLDRRDADEALEIVGKIPASTGLKLEIEDFTAIADAQRNAWIGSVSGLETAIAQAQQIDPSRPVYDKAQKLIARWQLEIEDVANLEKARTLASQGTVSDLNAAIAQARLIPANNPRGSEARQEMGRWRAEAETIEDKPYLERAEQISFIEDVNSLQAAIAEASQIRNGRALYPEARRKIRTWTAKIQRIQDQPYLDQARQIASTGDLASAVKAAEQIASSGRALSGEAQASIDDWRGQIRARQNWRKAREVALAGTPEALSEAIQLADRVPSRSLLRNDVNPAIDQWSQQLLDIARSQSESDVVRAIETAKLIPQGSAAYSAAREQIRSWRDLLKPEPEPEPQQFPEESTTTPEQQ